VAEPIRLYFDQHMQGAVVHGLRLRGMDVLTAQDAGRCGLSDQDQLAFAAAEGRVMVTFDSDYLALHRSDTPHEGIAWCPATKHSVGELIRFLLLLHAVMDRDAMRNHVEYI
jgi:predicted nuclease of predicted toxin-antitoxin system